MWCKKCNIETNELVCPICNEQTTEDIPVEIYWCTHCHIPIIQTVTQADKGLCPTCGSKTKYLSADLRPVFPEERLLLELLLGKSPNEYIDRSVWAVNSRYYIDSKAINVPISVFQHADADDLAKKLEQHALKNSYDYFNNIIQRFIETNQDRLCFLKDEAFSFIRNASERFDDENIVVSFSGGKDSTVTADLAIKALSNPSLVHESELIDVKKRLRDLMIKKDKLNRDDGQYKGDIERYKKLYDSLVAVSGKNKQAMILIAYAEEIRDWLTATYKEKEYTIREELETKVNEIFEKMYHGHRRVAIDMKYQVSLLTTIADKEIAAGESEGSNRVKNFAFIAGLVSLAKEKIVTDSSDQGFNLASEPYPLVMDAPF